MARSTWACPNCESEMCSAIKFWKPKPTDYIDAYKCHDCDQLTAPATKEELPEDWQPPRPRAPGQLDLYGNIKNIRDVIDPVPRMVESPAGMMVGVYRVPKDAPPQYREEIKRMMFEINLKHSGREMPYWYKYRKIKRRKK